MEEKKKQSANDVILTMVRQINANKIADFYNTISTYADTFAFSSKVRADLFHCLRQKPVVLRSLDQLPSNVKNLLIQNELRDENVFLNEQTNKLIEDLILEWRNIPVYEFHNLKVRNKVLLHGTTGNGKTTIARHIARMSKLPFVEIKGDEVIDSHLGSTGSNIYNIFNQIKEPCVMFWDEIDSVGCKRGTDVKAAGHENDRMTNSLLVNIEKLSSDVVFIGATNRRNVLDSAFVRRFDVQYEVQAPIEIEKERFANQLISYYKLPIETPELNELNSYSDIKNNIVSIAREMVLTQITNQAQSELN